MKQSEIGWQNSGYNGAVSAGGAEAVEAGMQILKQGGTAADGATATILALTITDGQQFGAEVPIIVYDAKRKVVETLSGQGGAPRLATAEYFRRKNYKAMPEGHNVESAAVPGMPDALVTMLARYGTLSFSRIAEPALQILSRRREPCHTAFAAALKRLIEAEEAAGPDRQRGLRFVADCFYRGPIAREIDQWSRKNGGLLRYTDLATHVTRVEEPLSINYRGLTINKCSTWTQGPCLLQTMLLLESHDTKALQHNSAAYIHLVTEAMKLGLADRDEYYADPLYADVPIDALLSRQYAQLRRPLIDLEKASHEFRPGDPVEMKALSARPNTPSGGGVPAGKTGIILGSRLQSANLWPGHPNCIESGKRPRITLTPTLVMKDNKPVIAISVAGGDMQDQATIQVPLNMIDFGFDAAKAVRDPRFVTRQHVGSFSQTPSVPASLRLHRNTASSTIEELQKKGHCVELIDHAANPSAITFDAETGLLSAAGDPAAYRHADAF